MEIGYPNGGHRDEQWVYVEDTGSDVWHNPYPIEIPGDRDLELYLESNSVVEIFSETLPDDVIAIARNVVEYSYFPIIQQAGRFVLWGFSGHPELMTGMGQEIFVNLVWYME